MVNPNAGFTSLHQLAHEKKRLDDVRKMHGARLERHWEALKDHEVRGLLLQDAVSDLFRSWKPARFISGLVGGGSLTGALGAAVFRKGGIGKRIFSFIAALAVPYLVKRAGGLSLDDIMHQIKLTMDRVREHMTQRSEEPRNG